MCVAALAQRAVVTFARQVAYNCYARAVIERIAKTLVAGVSRQDMHCSPLCLVTAAVPRGNAL